MSKATERKNALHVSKAVLKGNPGQPVPEDPQRWTTRQVALCRFVLNGDPVEIAVPAHWTLLEALRYIAGLTGSKQGCDKGDCGACTVRVDGEAILSCITLALTAEGREVETVEGLSVGGTPHPLQDAFDACGAAQCGFCTPGILMTAAAYLEEAQTKGQTVQRSDIAAAIGGNLCRCTGYTKILEAIEQAWSTMRATEP